MIFKILKNISGNNQAKGEKDEGVRDESKTMRRALFQALGIQPRKNKVLALVNMQYIKWQ